MNQVTIQEKSSVEGVNIYNGGKAKVVFHPSEDSGLVFLVKGKRVPAKLEHARNKWKSITLNNGRQSVYLIEHLLSAVYALGIDNLLIELSGSVCPTVHNCSQEYVEALSPRIEQSTKKKVLEICRK